MPIKRIGKTKNKLPLRLRVSKYRKAMEREYVRYMELATRSGEGHARAVDDAIKMLPTDPDLTDDQIAAHILEVYPRLDDMATQQAESYRTALAAFREVPHDSIEGQMRGEKMQYHKGAAYEYKRQHLQVRNLLNDLPED